MRLLIVLLLSLTVVSANYGAAAPAPQPIAVGEPAPGPAPACGLPARLDDDCTKFSQDSCSGGVTTTFAICRRAVNALCTKPAAFETVEACLANNCDSLEGDAGHPTETVRQVCRGTYDTKNVSPGMRKYFPTGVPAAIDGCRRGCERLVCAKPPPPPPVKTPVEIAQEPEVPPAPGLMEAYNKQQQQPAPVPAPAPVCTVPAKLDDDCTKFSQDSCSGGVTTTFAICRRAVNALCTKPAAFETVEACLANNCDSLEGDAGHPTETVRQVCRGTYDTKNVSPGMRKYFPDGVPATIDGVRRGCERLVCAKPPPPPPVKTPVEIAQEPEVPPAPGLMEAYNKQQAEKQAPPAPAGNAYQAPAPKPVEQPKPAPVPVPVPVPPAVPVPTTPVTQDCSVIMVDADEEDCTADLRKEVEQLEKYVDQLTILLASKGAKFTEACVVTTGTGGDKPKDNTPPNGGGNGGDKPKDTPPNGGGGDKPKDNTPPNGGGNGGDKPKDNTPPNGGGGGGDKPKDNTPPNGGGNGGDKPKDNTPPNGGGNGGNNGTPNGGGNGGGNGGHNGTPNGQGGNGGNTGAQNFNAGAGVPTTSHSSSAGVSAMLVAGVVIGSAVAAGICAVAIGFFVAAPAAGGAAVVSAAPMTCAATNPLYVPLTNGGTNLLA